MGKSRKPPEENEPAVYAVRKGATGWQLNRRNLFRAAAAAASGAALAGSAKAADSCPEGSRAHLKEVNGLAVYANGTRLASSSRDMSVKLWSLPDGSLLKTIGLTKEALGVFVTPDSSLLVTATSDGVQLFALPDGSLAQTLSAAAQYFTPDSVAMNKAGTVVAAADYQTIQIWSLPGGARVRDFKDESWASVLAFSPDGSLLATGGHSSSNVRVWSVAQGTLVRRLAGTSSGIASIAIRPDGGALAASGYDGYVRMWSLPDGAELPSLQISGLWSEALLFSPDGRLLICEESSYPVLWEMPGGTKVKAASRPSVDIILSMALTPDSELLVVGCVEDIHVYTVPDLRLLDRCMVDPVASGATTEIVRYTKDGGEYTLPCGSAIPAGAVCTCNCVPGAGCPCVNYSTGGGHYWFPN